MKQYVYIKKDPMTVKDVSGVQIEIVFGSMVFTNDNVLFEFTDRRFTLSVIELSDSFQRIYTAEETARYERIHDEALIAAMQSLIGIMGNEISADLHEVDNVVKNAIWLAGRLVSELKKKEE